MKKNYEVSAGGVTLEFPPIENEELYNKYGSLVPAPRTPQQVACLVAVHAEFFGVCAFCGCAGHVDTLAEVDGNGYCATVECCDECTEKIKKEEGKK
jgi:hypothetical protein